MICEVPKAKAFTVRLLPDTNAEATDELELLEIKYEEPPLIDMEVLWPTLRLTLLGLSVTWVLDPITVIGRLAQMEAFNAQTVALIEPWLTPVMNNVFPESCTEAIEAT